MYIYHSKFIVTYAFHWQELHKRSYIYGTKKNALKNGGKCTWSVLIVAQPTQLSEEAWVVMT